MGSTEAKPGAKFPLLGFRRRTGNDYEAEYKKYETAYKTDETQATEYQYYLEYTAAVAAAAKLKTESEEATESAVTTESGTTC